MKICIFTHTFPRFAEDSCAPFIDELACALVEMKHKVVVLAPFTSQIDFKYKRPYKIVTYKYIFLKKLHILGYSQTLKGDKTIGLIQYILSPFLYFFGFLALLKLVRKEKIDIISSHWIIPNGFIAALVRKVTKVPFTATVPGSDAYLASRNFFFRWMARFAAMNAGCVISDSPYYLKQLNELNICPFKTEIIRYGVNVHKFRPETKNERHQPSVLAVGRMVAKKGFEYLIKAMPEIVRKIPNVKLKMVGSGEEESKLRFLVKKLGITNNVQFIGIVSHNKLADYYRSADVFVMPSIKDEKGNIDASPVSMMEAMSCGLPVVTTKLAGDKSLVIKGKTGYLVKEKDSYAIARSVISLLKNRDRKFKTDVRDIAVANFSSESAASKYTNCFENCIILD